MLGSEEKLQSEDRAQNKAACATGKPLDSLFFYTSYGQTSETCVFSRNFFYGAASEDRAQNKVINSATGRAFWISSPAVLGVKL